MSKEHHSTSPIGTHTRRHRASRKLKAVFAVALAAGAAVAVSLPAVASAQWTSSTPRTVRNFCYLNPGLGPSARGTAPDGTPFVAFDTNHDGIADAWVFALNGSRYYNTVGLDNGEDGITNYVGICATGQWYTTQRVETAVQTTQRRAATRQEPASTCAETPGCESLAYQQMFDASAGLASMDGGSTDGVITDPDTGNPDGM